MRQAIGKTMRTEEFEILAVERLGYASTIWEVEFIASSSEAIGEPWVNMFQFYEKIKKKIPKQNVFLDVRNCYVAQM